MSDADEWKKLIEEIANCRKCELHKYRKNPVPGEGNTQLGVMLIGEAPGKNEDEQGRPFVGAAGQFLNELLKEARLRREDVYITNVVKCRPPNNRDPSDEEIEACLPFLRKQIRLVKPKVIIALGRHAGRTLFRLAERSWINMKYHHGKVYRVRVEDVEVVLVPTYHPAAALYNPQLKEELVKDFRESVRQQVEILQTSMEKTRKKTLLDFIVNENSTNKKSEEVE